MNELLSPPSKLIAVHLNYRSRAEERGRTPANPSYFLKAPSTLSGHQVDVVRPGGCELLAFEGEILIVIGTTCRQVKPGDAWRQVGAVTAANDFGVYDLRYADPGSNVHSKGFDGFTPVGPTLLDPATIRPSDLRLRTWVNGAIVQDALTSEDMLFDPAFVIADLSRMMTLVEGDMILMGTPTGSSVVTPGDLVEVEVSVGEQSTGRLTNRIVDTREQLGAVGAMPIVNGQTLEAAYSPGTRPN
jgi:2-keto-4-pentenoate hydratase/2-oxohepta-3-ene-1,7-dioic acid hydratase in catechol pathway